jgi:hypothetical protein
MPMSNFHAIPRQLGCHSHFPKLHDDIYTMEINTITSAIAVDPAIVPQLLEKLPQRCKKINVDIKANFRYPENDSFRIFY